MSAANICYCDRKMFWKDSRPGLVIKQSGQLPSGTNTVNVNMNEAKIKRHQSGFKNTKVENTACESISR